MNNPNRFSNLSYRDFANMAKDDRLSRHEKIGFPDSYREGKEQAIFNDIQYKMQIADIPENSVILDIGPGCSQLPVLLADFCADKNGKLLLVDSPEMLSLIPDIEDVTEKHPGYFPDVDSIVNQYHESIHFILCYSVFHYIFEEGNIWTFLDETLSLLAEGGALLIGDIPNISMRKRFFSSPNGIRFHQEFTGSNEVPLTEFNKIEKQQIDDSVLFAIMQRARSQGFDAYIMPQNRKLPMANRREDILIRRP